VSKIKKKSVGIYFSFLMGIIINFRIKRFNLQSQIHVRFPNIRSLCIDRQWCKSHTLGINFHMSCHSNRSVICTTDVQYKVNRFYFREPNTNEQVYQQFSKTHNHLIERSDSGKL
jgi:hypothetical protein